MLDGRLAGGTPCLGAWLDERPVGVALLIVPDRPTPPELEAQGRAVLEAAGPRAVQFFRDFLAELEKAGSPKTDVWLGILAVDPECQGLGIGRRLIEATMDVAATIPGCTGVTLDTEGESNVAIYRRCGFEVTKRLQVEDMPIHVMRRPL